MTTSSRPHPVHVATPLLLPLPLPLPLVACVALCLAPTGCEGRPTPGKAAEPRPATDSRPKTRPTTDPRPGATRPATSRRAAAPPRNVIQPRADLVPRADRFSFLVFGDSRENRCHCDPPRTRRRSCPVQRVTGPAATDLCDRAPQWLYGDVLAALGAGAPGKPRRDDFALHTGDLVYRGSCVKDWARLRRDLLDRLPKGRFFPAIGNHDVWRRRGEPDPVPIFFATFPDLTAPDGTRRRPLPYYAFRVGRALFVTLDTGGYPQHGDAKAFQKADRRFFSSLATLEEQLRWLREVLAWAATWDVQHVFAQYHKPSFTTSGHPPLVEAHDPLTVLRPFKAAHPAVNVLALTGHNHTTEVHLSGGVVHLVAGGGGAHQYLRRYTWGKPNQPEDRFWPPAPAPRTLRYNVFRVLVEGPTWRLQERCLAWRGGRVVVEDGARMDAAGKVTHRPGACAL